MSGNTNNWSAQRGRRDLIKMGFGVGAAASLAPLNGVALEADPRDFSDDELTFTNTGWKNDANRAYGNGPIDNTSREIIKYVQSFNPTDLTASVVEAGTYTLIDSLAALVAGFEIEPARICARIAQTLQSDMKCTMLGYDIVTTPEMASFGNGAMMRGSEFNDLGPGGHISDILPGIFAIAEAVHANGRDVLAAINIGYQLYESLAAAGAPNEAWDSLYQAPAAAMACGKLLKLNVDQMANALSLSIVAHMPMKVSHVGALSHWKGVHSSEAVRCAVFCTLLAREGITAPGMPFEARGGLFDIVGPFRHLTLPTILNGKSTLERMGHKRFPSEGSTQSLLELTPEFHGFAAPEDIDSIHIDFPFSGWQEIGDPPKWDPRNSETADHSAPCVAAMALIFGEIYLTSFLPEYYGDPRIKMLMERTIVTPDPSFTYQGQVRLTVKTKSGKTLSRETAVHLETPMTQTEILAKFNRACDYRRVNKTQCGQAKELWLNINAADNFATLMQSMAKFGTPRSLSSA
jgi:2-methylcitrate dehydratase